MQLITQLRQKKLFHQASYIDGSWLQSQPGFIVTNPATGEPIAEVASAQSSDATAAVEAASAAFPAWSALTANDRSARLERWYDLMVEHQHALGQLLTLEQGKPLAEAIGEIGYGAAFVKWFAEEAKRVYGDTIPAAAADKRIMVFKQPVGVVAAVTPWNFPNAMIARKAAAALAAGCTFVVKPAQETPLSALAMAELAQQAGIPRGVFNVVVTDDAKAIGDVLTTHPSVAKFSFTGSTPVGKQLIQQCADSVKRVSMELGGNAPFIVFEDADLDAAVDGLIKAKFRNGGQTCVSVNRVFVHDKVADRFRDKLMAAMRDLKVGDGFDGASLVGPLISHKALSKVQLLLDEAKTQGASVVQGGEVINGNFMRPALVTGVANHMDICQQELFGPVVTVIGFSSDDEAIRQANDTEYGLAAYFYSRDLARCFHVAERLQFGMVGVNDGAISNAAAPFGGMKQSGYGREGSKYGLDDYLDIKYVSLGGLNG
jgi:succinate-semialdehyde dehydrogenase/glutarate-semialdehyde dehydrogenase